MIRTSIILLLMTATLFANSGKAIILMDYWVNYDYYATVLCENKDKPMMNCNGKCYLKKSIQQQEKQGQNSPLNTDKAQETIWNIHQQGTAQCLSCSGKELGTHYSTPSCFEPHIDLFRPPRAV